MKLVLLVSSLLAGVSCQFTSQNYPDPRLDPISCRLGLPSHVCDPSAVVSDEERNRLVQRINQLHSITSGIRNTSPACALQPDKTLEIIVAIIDKIGSIPSAPIDIEKFANNLKRKYQNFQDVGMCDTTVLIVNSRQDRQVFTVAGRDARISKDTLKNAFERNIVHFKSGRYALGLEGMIEVVVAAYSNAHIVQVSSSNQETSVHSNEFRGLPPKQTIEQQPFRAAGIPNSVQPAKKPFTPIDTTGIEEEDKVWISIMQQAIARCGGAEAELPTHVRAVVEEAMAISLKLISDNRYNSIEEEVESHSDVIGIRQRAWDKANNDFIGPLFNKYRNQILAANEQSCPAVNNSRRRRA